MGVTIEDVAREAGVSIATVSRYINGRLESMSEGTQSRLREVVARLGYVPNSAAQALKTGKAGLIGVALADIDHPYWSTVLAGVEETCQALGYGMVVTSASNRADIEHRYVGLFLNHRVDGILLNPAHADEETVARWSRLSCPVVMLDRTIPGLSFHLVAMDNVYGARLAIDHLLALGHRRIGFISWEIAQLSNRQERWQGYEAALRAAGIEPSPSDVRFVKESWQDGVRKTVALFRQGERPTAIFSANGELNLQVLAGLKQLGLRVPQDISVVGYDASPWDDLLDPPLTTVATPARRLGVRAVQQLCRMIEEGGAGRSKEIRLKPKLIVRASTLAR